MKHRSIFVAVILLLFTFSGFAQYKTSEININPQVSFYKDKYSHDSFVPLNPGAEILYEFGLNSKISLSSGVSYSYSIWKYSVARSSFFKRPAHELYLPVIMKFKFNQKFFTEFGLYSGWFMIGKELYMNNIDIRDWKDNTENTNYSSSSKFSADLYFGAGFNHVINEKRTIRFIPFLKYKLKDNWMGEVRERISAGVKINFVIGL